MGTLFNVNKIESGGLRILFAIFLYLMYIGFFSILYFFLANVFFSNIEIIKTFNVHYGLYALETNFYAISLFIITYFAITSFNLRGVKKVTFWYLIFSVLFFTFFYIFLIYLSSYIFSNINNVEQHNNIIYPDDFFRYSLIVLSFFATYLLFKPKKKQ